MSNNRHHYLFQGAYSIGKALRTSIFVGNPNPGPGSYQNASANRSGGWSILGRKQTNYQNQVPSPGEYSIKRYLQRPLKKGNFKPHQSPQTRIKQDIVQSQLKLPSFVNSKKGFSFGYRADALTVDRSPGPHDYNIRAFEEELREKALEKIKSLPQKDFGHTKKQQVLKSITPGPGAYFPSPYSLSNSFSIPRFNSTDVIEDSTNVGPGSYSPTLLSSSPKISISKSSKAKYLTNDVPGPGNYLLPQSRKVPSFKIVLPNNHKAKINQIPPPTIYQIPRFPGNAKKPGMNPSYSVRYDLHPNDNPGPGSYQLSNTISNRACTIGAKPKDSVFSKGPCPFTYSPKLDYVQKSNPTAKFCKGKRNFDVHNQNVHHGKLSFIEKDMNTSSVSYSIPKAERQSSLLSHLGEGRGQLTTVTDTIGLLPQHQIKKKI